MSKRKQKKPLVGVIMGSLSDYSVIEPGLDLFEKWGVPYEVLVASAHRTPDRVFKWAAEAESRGLETIIAAAGGAAHLPGVVAAHTILPVIGLPIESATLKGVDSLYSIVQMPPGIPVATVGINGSVNAAVLALHILARANRRWKKTLTDYRAGMADKVDRQNEELRMKKPKAVWAWDLLDEPGEEGEEEAETGGAGAGGGLAPWPEEPTTAEIRTIGGEGSTGHLESSSEPYAASGFETGASGKLKTIRKARRIGRVELESDLLPGDLAEQAVDCLLDGGIIAMPTDTVYGLAVEATNEEAVRRLYEIKAREAARPITVFIDSQKLLSSLVLNLTPEVKRMLEAFWPGPLTVVFTRRGKNFRYLSPGSTLGVRLPKHSVPLTIMQELRRPIACTSANLSGATEARSGEEIEFDFGDSIDLILDVGPLPVSPPSTVIDVTQVPYRILRKGAVSASQLAAVVGDLLQTEEEE